MEPNKKPNKKLNKFSGEYVTSKPGWWSTFTGEKVPLDNVSSNPNLRRQQGLMPNNYTSLTQQSNRDRITPEYYVKMIIQKHNELLDEKRRTLINSTPSTPYNTLSEDNQKAIKKAILNEINIGIKRHNNPLINIPESDNTKTKYIEMAKNQLGLSNNSNSHNPAATNNPRRQTRCPQGIPCTIMGGRRRTRRAKSRRAKSRRVRRS